MKQALVLIYLLKYLMIIRLIYCLYLLTILLKVMIIKIFNNNIVPISIKAFNKKINNMGVFNKNGWLNIIHNLDKKIMRLLNRQTKHLMILQKVYK